jgi:hypothetical protein
MSSVHDRNRELQVLCSPYKQAHFLLNRTQCSSSLFASDVTPIRTRHRYMGETILSDECRVLLFDLNRFWSDTFRVSTTSSADLAMVTRVELLSQSTRQWMETRFFPQITRLRVCTDRIAFRIPSNTTILTLAPTELARHDRILQKPLVRRGIMAVHPTDHSLGFFFDLEQLLLSRLLFLTGPIKEAER